MIPLNNFNPKFRLSEELRIVSAGTQFYAIGISLFKESRFPKRHPLHHPIYCFVIQMVYIIRSVIILMKPKADHDFYRMIGDFGFIFGTVAHFNATVIFTVLLSFETQLLNILNYWRGVRPSYMRVFNMISGHIPPEEVGLTDEKTVRDLIRRTRILFRIGEYIPLSLSSGIFCINIISFYQSSTWDQLILQVIPHSMGWFLIVRVVYNNTFWHLIYFYLMTFYLMSKLKEVNTELISMSKHSHRISCVKIVNQLNHIFHEIHEYNGKYWSYFILIIWINCAAILSTLSFFLIFGEMIIFLRIIVLYFDTFFVILLLLIIRTCASVYLEANKSYKLLNCLVANGKTRNSMRMFKVRRK